MATCNEKSKPTLAHEAWDKNPMVTPFSRQITPHNIASARSDVMSGGKPVRHMFIGANLFTNLFTRVSRHPDGNNIAGYVVNESWELLLDPVNRKEDWQSGFVGRLLGMDLFTDFNSESKDRFLDPDKFYLS